MASAVNATQTKVGFTKFLLNGLLVGLIAAAANNIWGFIYGAFTGFSLPEVVNIVSITLASIIPILIGAIVYFGLSRFMPDKASLIFIIGSLVLAVLSLAGGPLSATLPDGSPTPAGFAGLTAPMHIIAGLVCAFLLPRLVKQG